MSRSRLRGWQGSREEYMGETFVMGENMRVLLAQWIVKSTAPTSQEASQEKVVRWPTLLLRSASSPSHQLFGPWVQSSHSDRNGLAKASLPVTVTECLIYHQQKTTPSPRKGTVTLGIRQSPTFEFLLAKVWAVSYWGHSNILYEEMVFT